MALWWGHPYLLYSVCPCALSMGIKFATLTYWFILYRDMPAYYLYLMEVICLNLPSVNIWEYVFLTMEFSVKNTV